MRIAYALPERTLGNDELSAMYPEWSSEKILAKTGITTRHVAAEGETATDLAERAAKRFFAENGVDPRSVDFILFCTQSPDYLLPSSSCILQDRLGISRSAGALDYNLGCSGFVYGLSLAKGLLMSGSAKSVLLLTSETYSKYIHPKDRSVRTIFGDGAAATLVREEDVGDLGMFVLGTNGAGADWLKVPNGGSRHAHDPAAPVRTDGSGNERTDNNLFMSGVDIFKFTIDIVPKTLDEVCTRNGVAREDIDLFVFHQANAFMLETLRASNRLPRERFLIDLSDVGNTVSASIPIALARAEAAGRLKDGMRVLVMGFGVGLSWGATIIRWRQDKRGGES